MPERFFTNYKQAAVLAVSVIAALAAGSVVTWAVTRADPPPPPGRDEPAAYTKWYVQQAVDRYERDGRQAIVDFYNAGGGVDGPWYMFVLDAASERYIAHATIPNGVGDDANLDVDVNGYPYGARILEAAEDGFWVDYAFLDLSTGEGGEKHAWVVRRDGLIFGSGWYEGAAAAPPTKNEPGAYAKELVRRAAWRYEVDRAAAVDYYNTPESVDGEWYVFIADAADGALLAHANQALLGELLTGPVGTDVTGYDFGSVILGAPETGMWVDYVFTNPATGRAGVKHSWVIRYKDLIFGSGWYEGV